MYLPYNLIFFVPKDVELRYTHHLIVKTHNKKDLQNVAINHSTDMDYKDFMNIYGKCTSNPCSFLTIDTTLPADNP